MKKRLLLFIGLLILVLGGLYTYQANFYSKHFYPNTVVNKIPIGNMTTKEAADRLDKTHAQETITLTNDGKVWQELNLNSLGLTYDVKSNLNDHLSKQKNSLWLLQRFNKQNVKISDATLDENKFTEQINGVKTAVDVLNENREGPKDAFIEESDKGLAITPEVVGNTLNTDKIIEELKKAVTTSQDTLEIKEFVKQPKVKSTDKTLKKALEAGKKIADQSVIYTINGKDINVPKETITSWITYNSEEQNVSLNYEKVYAYVSELGDKYDTSNNPTKFKSTKQGEVEVPAGTYSWTIQAEAETNALMEEVLAGNGVKRSPIINGSASVGAPLIGDTYVEVDLKKQHMYFYKEGKLFLDTAVVTGKPKTPTPPGVNYLWKKERHSTLRGTNDDGSKYAEPVDYWMPIDWTGVGVHDSPWQPEYGGTRWADGFGSHGCVNTPPDVMKKLYENIEIGTPVIVL